MSRPHPERRRSPLGRGSTRAARIAGATLLLSIALAGCGGAASEAPATTPTPTPMATPTAAPTAPPTPTPEPTPDLEALAEQYLEYVADFGAAQAAASAAVGAATNDAEASAAYQLYVEAEAAAIEALGQIDLPADLAVHRDTMIEALTTVKEVYEQLVVDPQDPDPTIDTRLADAVATVFAAGSAIRLGLGLPPPTTPAPD